VGAYRKAGFREEGRLRQAALVAGDFHDELVMSVLRAEHSVATPLGKVAR
jgi:RimJ/RimL family protein N-acetyltransferase